MQQPVGDTQHPIEMQKVETMQESSGNSTTTHGKRFRLRFRHRGTCIAIAFVIFLLALLATLLTGFMSTRPKQEWNRTANHTSLAYIVGHTFSIHSLQYPQSIDGYILVRYALGEGMIEICNEMEQSSSWEQCSSFLKNNFNNDSLIGIYYHPTIVGDVRLEKASFTFDIAMYCFTTSLCFLSFLCCMMEIRIRRERAKRHSSRRKQLSSTPLQS